MSVVVSLTKRRLNRSRSGTVEGFMAGASPTDLTVVATLLMEGKAQVVSVSEKRGFLSCHAVDVTSSDLFRVPMLSEHCSVTDLTHFYITVRAIFIEPLCLVTTCPVMNVMSIHVCHFRT